jgi:hypothetical protein
MSEQSFEAAVHLEGQFVFVPIPFHPPEVWGKKPRYHVAGTINNHPVRGCLGVLRQDYFLRLGAAWIRDSGIQPGQQVRVRLAPEGPQEDNLAADIVQALSKDKTVLAFFEGLPTFYRKNYIRWIESAKREETRAKRVTEMMGLLSEGKRER